MGKLRFQAGRELWLSHDDQSSTFFPASPGLLGTKHEGLAPVLLDPAPAVARDGPAGWAAGKKLLGREYLLLSSKALGTGHL